MQSYLLAATDGECYQLMYDDQKEELTLKHLGSGMEYKPMEAVYEWRQSKLVVRMPMEQGGAQICCVQMDNRVDLMMLAKRVNYWYDETGEEKIIPIRGNTSPLFQTSGPVGHIAY
ncbi:MAG: hypothetical protein HY602_01830, partial [Parcubacteria group bacterium]|nr:hypothetical protein [Parcubacteria group bacterium]